MLILKGTRDRAFTERTLRKWTKGFPNACVHRLRDAGHFPHEEKGEAVSEVLLGFLRSKKATP
jgi:pimeloyl-ACP methyl ester carboxylesterase